MGCQYHESFIVIKNKLNMSRIFSSLNASFAVPWGRDVNIKKYSSNYNTGYQGIFLILRINLATNPIALFIFYDTKSKLISHYKFHYGKNYYKNYTSFIFRTLEDMKFNQKEVKVLAPKYFINQLLINNCKNILNVVLTPYSRKLIGLPTIISVIKNGVRGIDRLNKESFDLWITNFNLSRKDKGLFLTLGTLTKNIIDLKFKARDLFYNPIKVINRAYSTKVENIQSASPAMVKSVNHKWTSYNYDEFQVVNETVIINCLDSFWVKEIKVKLKDNPKLKIGVQLRVESFDKNVRSLSCIDTVTMRDLDILKEVYLGLWSAKRENYEVLNINKIILFYNILPEHYKCKVVSFQSKAELKSFKPSVIIPKIPKSMDVKKWGEFVYNSQEKIYNISIRNTIFIAKVISQLKQNIVYISIKKIGGLYELLHFRDEVWKDSRDLYTFKRFYKNTTLYFHKGIQVLLLEVIKCDFIKKLKPQKTPNLKIITMDLETREVDVDKVVVDKKTQEEIVVKSKKLEPVCISVFIGADKPKIITFKIWDFLSKEEMILAAFKTVMVKKYYGYSIYFHNFSYFDSIFLLKTLIKIPDTKLNPVLRKGKILKLNIQFDKRAKVAKSGSKYKGSINIYDSLLLLTQSLEKLGTTFGCESQKGMFPLKFLNDPTISLDYEGELPPLKYFYHPSPLNKAAYKKYEAKYKEFKETFVEDGAIKKWNLKNELVKYCEQDVITLHQVITAFTKEIYSRFEINILKYPTLPAIAFAIFRSQFMRIENIPIVGGAVYNDIRQSYYGGFVDVYKVYAKNVKSYDVNSLYPSSMKNFKLPVGNPTWFEGDSKNIKDLFGFVYTKVYAPNIHTPILPP